MVNKIVIKYFPQGRGAELFEELSHDVRLDVRKVTGTDPNLDYDNNVCAWVGDVAVGRPTRNGFLHELSKEIRKDFSSYRSEEANV